MLRDLHIRNLAVLEEATVSPALGFIVLSGETGAGKSIVVDSLALLAGGRASSELIRTGADSLSVTGVFAPSGKAWREVLDEAGLESDGEEVVIRREISRSGRNRVFLNDRPVTLKLVGDLAPWLLRIHGQREELGLVDPELQRVWLDRCGGSGATELHQRLAEAHTEYRRLARRLEELAGDRRSRGERVDFLRFQIAEIDDVAPEVDEEIGLRQERAVLRHSEAIQQALSVSCNSLFDQDNAAYDELGRALSALEQVESWEPNAAGWVSELEEIRIRLAEIESGVRHRLDSIDAEPGRLDSIEDRLAALERLFRKHGDSTRELLERRSQLAAELAALSGDESSLAELEARARDALSTVREGALELSKARRGWARTLERRVTDHLRELSLGKAVFEVELRTRRKESSPLRIAGEPVEFNALGIDQVVYQFTPNPGEELRPLAKVASGGELSRLYLAVQLAAGGDRESEGPPVTLVFDEVDAGISGAEAAVLGAKLRRLAAGGQVLAVTHLPQVASQADVHYKVSKVVESGRTRTRIEELREEGRVEEVARMLAGSEITELSLSHARELIVGANA